jgi:hypothetical protein
MSPPWTKAAIAGGRRFLPHLPVTVTAVALLVWWSGWNPGILSTSSVHLWDQVITGDFDNVAPAVYPISMWVVTRLWESPAFVVLIQIALVVLLLFRYQRAADRLGVPRWLSGIAVLAVGLLPAPASAIVSIDPGVARGIAALWLLVESLVVAHSPATALADRTTAVRLGLAAGAVSLLAPAGWVIGVGVLAALWFGVRRKPHLVWIPAALAVGLFVLVRGPVYALVDVDGGVPVGEAYAPEIAAVVKYHPESLDEADRTLLERAAPLDVWRDAYRCADGEALLTDREFDVAPIRSDPGAYRGLLFRMAAAEPATVIGHRVCAAGLVFLPWQPVGERFVSYTYIIPPNEAGLKRDTLWARGFNITKALLVRVDNPWNRWLFWRPGILVWPALAMVAAAAIRRRRRILFPGLVFVAVLGVTALTIRAPVYVDLFAVYLLALAALPLWWAVFRRQPSQ